MNHRIGNLLRELSYSLRRSLSLFIGTLVTILISLIVLGGAWTVRVAVANATERWQDGVEFVVFMIPDASDIEIETVGQKLASHPEIDGYDFVSKTEAFEEFQRMFPESDLLGLITAADMPASFKVRPSNTDADIVETLADGFRDEAGVVQVSAAVDTLKAIEDLTRGLSLVLLVIGLVLLISAMLLVYNTIRTTIFARRREIEVMRLVGASNWYIRLPFMTEGVLQGLIGGALTYPVLRLWSGYLSNLGDREGLRLLQSLGASGGQLLSIWIALMFVGALIGAVASALALSRFLDI